MPTIKVSRVLSNPKFAQMITVFRQTGEWINGRWIVNPEQQLNFYGVVAAAGTKDIIQVPEGDRSSQVMMFYTKQEVFITRVDEVTPENSGTSDQVLWRGNRYRINKVMGWTDFGYFKSFGVSMEGN